MQITELGEKGTIKVEYIAGFSNRVRLIKYQGANRQLSNGTHISSSSDLFKSCIAHWTEIESEDSQTYPGDTERFSYPASFSNCFNLMRLGIHHERLPPGRRVSWPHAEADEEEFVYVIEGTPDLWLDGHLKRLGPGDGVAFRPGTGLAHTFISNTESDVRLLVVGEASRNRSRVHYPLNPARNAEIGERHWKDGPRRPLGPHDGKPDWPR